MGRIGAMESNEDSHYPMDGASTADDVNKHRVMMSMMQISTLILKGSSFHFPLSSIPERLMYSQLWLAWCGPSVELGQNQH